MPLEGIRVTQMESFGPAEFAAFMLGDLGADFLLVGLPNPRPYPSIDPDMPDDVRCFGHEMQNRR